MFRHSFFSFGERSTGNNDPDGFVPVQKVRSFSPYLIKAFEKSTKSLPQRPKGSLATG
jgi:hypothetical protein